MWEVRNRVQSLIKESMYTYQALSEEIEKRYGYKVCGSEMSRFIKGELDTPKARKALTDALEILNSEKRRRDTLLEQSA